MGTPQLVSRKDGEWWLSGLPFGRGKDEQPPRNPWVELGQGGIAGAAAVLIAPDGWIAAVMCMLTVMFTAIGIRLWVTSRLDKAALARTAAVTIGPLIYVIGTLVFRYADTVRHTFQITGLGCYAGAWVLITVIDRTRRGERTG